MQQACFDRRRTNKASERELSVHATVTYQNQRCPSLGGALHSHLGSQHVHRGGVCGGPVVSDNYHIHTQHRNAACHGEAGLVCDVDVLEGWETCWCNLSPNSGNQFFE